MTERDCSRILAETSFLTLLHTRMGVMCRTRESSPIERRDSSRQDQDNRGSRLCSGRAERCGTDHPPQDDFWDIETHLGAPDAGRSGPLPFKRSEEEDKLPFALECPPRRDDGLQCP